MSQGYARLSQRGPTELPNHSLVTDVSKRRHSGLRVSHGIMQPKQRLANKLIVVLQKQALRSAYISLRGDGEAACRRSLKCFDSLFLEIFGPSKADFGVVKVCVLGLIMIRHDSVEI